MNLFKVNRERALSALLIAVSIVSVFTVIVPVEASRRNVIRVPEDFSTIEEAIVAANDGDTILVGPGKWYGAIVNKAVEIKGMGEAIIDDGPTHPRYSWIHFGFKLESDGSGATISHLTFKGLELPIYGFMVDDVIIEHNTIYNALQGITNWDGDNWVIKHNVIEGIYGSGGGGLGIFIGSLKEDYGASGNLVVHNTVVAQVPDDRTYSCGGICLCADARWGAKPGEVSNNKVVHNKVVVTGPDTFALSLEVIGLGDLSELEESEYARVIEYAKGRLHDNIVGFNDVRGSTNPIDVIPEELKEVNTISRNLGRNRGHGVVPAEIFKPVKLIIS